MHRIAQKITNHPIFSPVVMAIIIVASILVGLETVPSLVSRYDHIFTMTSYAVQALFTIEVGLRIMAEGRKPWNFFRSGWNVFDFMVTAIFYLPFDGHYASVLRLVRIFRVFRVVSALPRLQMLVGALIKSIPSIGYVSVLLFIQFYIFAVIGNFQFGEFDPVHFGDLGRALITLFEIVTLEGWVEVYQSLPNVVPATIYFISFIVLGTMIILNLFIGVVLNGFEEVKQEMEEMQHREKPTLAAELKVMTKELDDIKIRLHRLTKLARRS